MATYNGERFIAAQLESLAAQTLAPTELVVCDDGSSDGTVAIVEAFARKAPFEVRLIRNEKNLGYIRNFEKALSLCTGEVVFLSDQDDVWFPEKIDHVLAVFAAEQAAAVLNDQIIADGELRSSGQSKLANIRQAGLSDDVMITGCCTAINASLKALCLPFPESIPAHDIWIGRMAVLLGVRRVLDEPLQLYRRHGDNTSNWMFSADRPVGRLRMLRSEGWRDRRDRRRRNLALLKALRERLIERNPQAQALAGPDAVSRALADLDRDIAALENRPAWKDLVPARRLLRLAGLGGG
jgi:glycosyltransferase involved in cell wall biosynthesis